MNVSRPCHSRVWGKNGVSIPCLFELWLVLSSPSLQDVSNNPRHAFELHTRKSKTAVIGDGIDHNITQLAFLNLG